jgi:hypothetical protein
VSRNLDTTRLILSTHRVLPCAIQVVRVSILPAVCVQGSRLISHARKSDGFTLQKLPGQLSKSRGRRPSLRFGSERCIFLVTAVLIAGSATSLSQTETTADPGTPRQAIPGTNGVSPFAASVPAKLVPGILPLSLRDAIDRGLKQNLGLLLSNADIRAARGLRWEQLSALLPHVTAAPYIAESEINFDEIGFASLGNRLAISPSIGPYSYFDARASVTQTLFDWKSINATRAASQSVKSTTYTLNDARDLVVLAVGYSYLRAIADAARIETAEAQVETGQALYNHGGRPGECRHFPVDRRPARQG